MCNRPPPNWDRLITIVMGTLVNGFGPAFQAGNSSSWTVDKATWICPEITFIQHNVPTGWQLGYCIVCSGRLILLQRMKLHLKRQASLYQLDSKNPTSEVQVMCETFTNLTNFETCRMLYIHMTVVLAGTEILQMLLLCQIAFWLGGRAMKNLAITDTVHISSLLRSLRRSKNLI